MLRPPRATLPALALTFAAGIALADAAWPLAPMPWPWLASAMLVLVRWPRVPGAALVVALCLGGAAYGFERGAGPRSVPGLDDRVADRVEGVVSGPIEDGPGRRRYVIERDDGSRIEVTTRAAETGLPAVLPGDRVVVTGRLRRPRGYRVEGAADALRRAASAGFDLRVSARPGDVEIVKAGWSAWRGPARLQRWAAATVVARGGDEAGQAVVRALVAGDRGGLTPELSRRFQGAGISHVLAVSGLHVSAMAFLMFAVARWLWAILPGRWPRRLEPKAAAAWIALATAALYALTTGARPSTMRALVVVGAALVALVLDRRVRVVDALGLAALAILAHRPSALWDIGAQLSFAASATLALAFTGRRVRSRRWWRPIVDLALASLWAGAATAPIAAWHFHTLAIAGLPGNLVAVPVTELVLLPCGLAGVALSAVSPELGGVVLDLAIAVAGFLAEGARLLAELAPPRSVSPPSLVGLALWGLAMAALLAGRRDRRWIAAAAACAILAVGTGRLEAELRGSDDRLRITFLDVGQGDSAVVEMPGGAVWLIDVAGLPFVPADADDPERLAAMPGERAVLPFLAARRIESIDVLVISHPHPDHYLGLGALIGVIDIDEVWLPEPDPDDDLPPALRRHLGELRARGTRVVHPPLGLAASGAAEVTVLGPRYESERAAVDPVLSTNDNSLVLRIDFAGRRVLFAGDVEIEGESLLDPRELAADLVKVPHHGSPTSSTDSFVAATAPLAVVISCGLANRFGFPDADVLARWEAAGADVWRTDWHGSVTAVVGEDGSLTLGSLDPR